MGQITNWNDPAIKALNPKATIPDLEDHAGLPHRQLRARPTTSPTTCRRSARAGSRQLGTGQVGQLADRHRRERQAPASPARSRNTPGAIGYTDTAFAIANHLQFASIKNAAGNFINPSIRNVAAAGGAVTSVPANNELHIVNPPKSLPTAYPIATYTYIILPTKTANATALRKMVFWALTQGQAAKYTAKLWFVADPEGRARRVREDAEADPAVDLGESGEPPRPGVTERKGADGRPSAFSRISGGERCGPRA